MIKVYIIALCAMSAVTFGVYGWDKLMAKQGGWRIPERTLILLSALLGGPGGFLAMRLFRHKTLHKKFTLTVPVFAILQIAALFVIK